MLAPPVRDRAAERAPDLSATLHGFQREAVRFGLQRGGRVLLGDEMGLGKTIQVIALVAHVREKNVKGPICIAAPLATRVAASSHHFDGVGGGPGPRALRARGGLLRRAPRPGGAPRGAVGRRLSVRPRGLG